MPGALLPFFIYWGVLVAVCVVFLTCPVLFIVILPLLLIIVPLWLIAAYLVGDAVQRRGRLEGAARRMALSLLCSFLVIAVYPVGFWLYDAVQWNAFEIGSLVRSFSDRPLWIIFALHVLMFWAGEEIGHTATKE
ncbi:MAG TPA: hypothetical protein DF613_04435 [Lachnospiraceae bacterium]|nr:hypothetical protein [Lachnospiraceae bacterium]